jgi:hypothetical protein
MQMRNVLVALYIYIYIYWHSGRETGEPFRKAAFWTGLEERTYLTRKIHLTKPTYAR